MVSLTSWAPEINQQHNLQSTLAWSRIINSIMMLCYFFLPDLALFLPLFLPLGDGAVLVASACNAASAAAISSSRFLSASKYFCLNASRGRFISALLWSNSACIQKQQYKSQRNKICFSLAMMTTDECQEPCSCPLIIKVHTTKMWNSIFIQIYQYRHSKGCHMILQACWVKI